MATSRTYRPPVSLLAVLAALVGVCGSLAALYIANPYPRVVAPLVVLGAASWVFLRRRRLSVPAVRIPPGLYVGVYCLWLGVTVLLYVWAGYTRSVPVHLALLGLLVLVLAGVVVIESNAVRLAVLLVAGVVQRATVYYASALQIGNDAVWHVRIAAEIASVGTLEPLAVAGSRYWFMPLHHLLVGGYASVLQLSERHAAFIAVTVPLVVVPVLTIYAVLSRLGYRTIGVIAGWLYLVADRSIAQSIHVIPTSTGVVFACVLLLATIDYRYERRTSSLGIVLLMLIALWFTHPVGLFVTGVLVSSFVAGRALWSQSLDRRDLLLVSAPAVAVVTQFSTVKYLGPGSQDTLAARMLENVGGIATAGQGRASGLPSDAGFVVSGSDTLAATQLLGVGLLFGVGVLGALVWLSKTEGVRQEVIAALSSAVVVMSVAIYIPPVVGINMHFPYRWLSYLYVPLAMLAAAGIVVVARSVGRRRAVVAGVVLLAAATPYAAAMSWNESGSLDDPVMAESPTAQRQSATPTEAATYGFVTTYGSGERVIADRIAANYLERGATYPASTYALNYTTGESTIDGEFLFLDRAYAHSKHASFYVRYDGRWHAVYGSLPTTRKSLERTHSVVYVAGSDRVVYASAADEA